MPRNWLGGVTALQSGLEYFASGSLKRNDYALLSIDLYNLELKYGCSKPEFHTMSIIS